ncbi:glycosyltransferase [Halobium salinum]|uniref:Glycosyltransferase n=1 Tax=Halobium salinum TaxID=1364940 RepID=A0ABD5P9Z2_9EURY|nr:glycosyltransferase [Halobium salinum]
MSAEYCVLHVVTRSTWGGAQKVVHLLATRGHANASVACGGGGRLISELRTSRIPVFRLPAFRSSPAPLSDTRTLLRLLEILREHSFDLVHCHSTKAGLVGRLASLFSGVPTVFTVHGWGFYNTSYGSLRPLLVHGERALARGTTALVCVSENDRREGCERGILQNARTEVIHNGVPPYTPAPNSSPLWNELDIDDDVPVIGAVLRLAPQKDPLAILRVAKRLRGRGHPVSTVLIGDGPLAEDCKRFVRNNGMEDVHLLGFRQDALPLLADLDAFLLPSRFEGFPLTVLETMHLGVPIVAYDVGGVSEALSDRETGRVVLPGDEAAFTDAVEELVVNKTRRREMGDAARRRARNRFTAERMVADYDRLYDSILS